MTAVRLPPPPPVGLTRIVFTDFDGVLRTLTSHRRNQDRFTKPVPDPVIDGVAVPRFYNDGGDDLDVVLVRRLQDLCTLVDAKVVITAAERSRTKPEVIEGWLRTRGLTAPILGQTPVTHSEPRGAEIEAWIKLSNLYPDTGVSGRISFVVLEDNEDIRPFRSRQVQTTFEGGRAGLQDKHLRAALRIFERDTASMLRSTSQAPVGVP